MIKKIKSLDFRDFLPAMCMSLCMSFLAAIYAPLELFFTNLDEFMFSFSELFPELVKLFFLLLAVCIAVFWLCRRIHRKLYHAVLLVGLVGLICTYIQGVYMSGSLPPLDGTEILWDEYTRQNIASVVLWVIVVAGGILLTRVLRMPRMKLVVLGVSGFLSALMLVTLVTVGIQNNGFAEKNIPIPTREHAFDFSTEENLIIFVVDAVDSATFQTMMETTNPEFQEVLEDFTYYPDTVCAYPFTLNAIPYILTGAWYENQMDFRTFTTQAMDQSPLLNTLRERGYRMGVYEDQLVYDNDNVYDFENFKPGTYSLPGFWTIIKEEVKLVWFKYAPFPVKRFAPVYMDLYQSMLLMDDGEKAYQYGNVACYQDILNIPVTLTDEPCFRFTHIEGAHVPFKYNKNVEIIDESEGSYYQNIEASMTMVEAYLDKLKAAGVYDNSAIIIMSDHGYAYQQEPPVPPRGNALLLVKGIGEKHELQVSQAPISFEDLQTAYQRLLSGAVGDQVFDARPGDSRQRRFLLYYFLKEERMTEYIQYGHAADVSTLKPTGQVYIYEE